MTKRMFDIYSSKVKRINIPLPDFEYYHKSSSSEKIDTKFIGRDKISMRLYSWLVDERSQCGSYLVTGFRGMGKSSFVGRILYELSASVSSSITHFGGVIIILCIWGVIGYALFTIGRGTELTNVPWPWLLGILSLLTTILYILHSRYWFLYRWRKWRILVNIIKYVLFFNSSSSDEKKESVPLSRYKLLRKIFKDYKFDWHQLNRIIHNAAVRRKSYKRIPISINLGQDTLHERDILGIIAHDLYTKYRQYVLSPIANFWNWIIATAVTGATIFLFIETKATELFKSSSDKVDNDCINFINSLISRTESVIVTVIIVLCLLYMLYLLLYPYTQVSILRRLCFLCNRIDAQVEKEYSVGIKASWEKYNVTSTGDTHYSHKNSYPFAQVREIEQELIDILLRISKTVDAPRFIFVFDELDKIDSDTIPQQEQNPSPEFSNEKIFPGGGTSRHRKRNVLHLLANMKLFISTAKAKFIFISGRELYDAYLADLSDREFSISSVFNGVIYVDSFCSNEHGDKDIVSNTEAYISRQLIPTSYIYKQTIENYVLDKLKGKTYKGIDLSLKLYYKYLTETYSKVFGYKNLDVEVYSDNTKNYTANEIRIRNEIRACIDKTIQLLYRFSDYLYHISNGSPKKINLYFEKYIRTSSTLPQQLRLNTKGDTFSMFSQQSLNVYIDKRSRHYLSFGYSDQRTIGFIHYISFPVSQIIVNSSQFGDKLLVSASFLIDHIYKYHNSGFSWRNLEHTPELLQVYKIPEFRGFINAIISYLTHTHMIAVSCGLYQFKFRKQFSEEISLASKFSEEVASLFNFTLDESQSVRRHYLDLQTHYNLRLKQEKTESPHEKADIHHILADLHMADEEYTKAIIEYQTAITIINTQMPRPKADKHQTITSMLLLVRNMLKLGLAYEKRRTYESAYVTYNELISQLIYFRYLDEEKLGLKYVTKKKNEWPYSEAILYDSSSLKEKKKFYRPEVVDISQNKKDKEGFKKFNTSGPNIIADFAHLMTTDYNAVIQRLSMLEDIRLIYQALLAKLFVQEKMGLAGITRASLELLESEYAFLHLATNDTDKFLISTDFFRRLGDIMFYKNGLTGNQSQKMSLFEGLAFGTYDLKTEIHDFCSEHKCYHIKDDLLKTLSLLDNNESEKLSNLAVFIEEKWQSESGYPYSEVKGKIDIFCSSFANRLRNFDINRVLRCNAHRSELWKKNRPLPCFACKYYNRSLRILMTNLYGSDLYKECECENTSKTMIILREIVNRGTAKSLRQNFILQMAEDLDCLGYVMLSCATGKDNVIRGIFLKAFLNDVNLRYSGSTNLTLDNSELYKYYFIQKHHLNKIERSILYFWEASDGFLFANEHKKAADSMKKVLRVLQNYMKISSSEEDKNQKGLFIGEYLNDIKNIIVKQILSLLYSHYNYINIMEIQKLKWIFYVQMYEQISLSRLSLFPDVEEVMLIYYDMIRRSIVEDKYIQCNAVSLKNIEERNIDYITRIAGIYNNLSMGTLRLESNIYLKVLSLQFKTMLNKDILCQLFHHYGINIEKKLYEHPQLLYGQFVNFVEMYLSDESEPMYLLKEYSRCFPILFSCKKKEQNSINMKFELLEFLISDSMFCLTRILEVLTPYTATTFFTHTFQGEMYQMMFEWNQLFDSLYMFYKVIDLYGESNEIPSLHSTKCSRFEHDTCPYKERSNMGKTNEGVRKSNTLSCPYYDISCSYKATNFDIMKNLVAGKSFWGNMRGKKMLADTFFNNVLSVIGKSNVYYTLSNYSVEMSLKSYHQGLEMHREGQAYKEMVEKMYFLDDDLKNDTIQFDSALERYKINNDYVKSKIERMKAVSRTSSLYDIEKFCMDNEASLSLDNRFI